ELAAIGLVLLEAQEADARIVQQPLNVLGVEGGDEEGGIQLAALKGTRRLADALLDESRGDLLRRPTFLGIDDAIGGQELDGNGVRAAADRADPDPFAA